MPQHTMIYNRFSVVAAAAVASSWFTVFAVAVAVYIQIYTHMQRTYMYALMNNESFTSGLLLSATRPSTEPPFVARFCFVFGIKIKTLLNRRFQLQFDCERECIINIHFYWYFVCFVVFL